MRRAAHGACLEGSGAAPCPLTVSRLSQVYTAGRPSFLILNLNSFQLSYVGFRGHADAEILESGNGGLDLAK